MSILTSASESSVSRGYDYYKQKKVYNIKEVSNYEYEGYVKGSLKEPYYVKINIEHPRKSYCDCPFANGNKTCKHMVALYFSIFEDEAKDYQDWLESDYDNEEYDDYYDYYDDRYYNDRNNFEKPLFFEVVLNNYIESLSKEELKKVLKDELLKDEEKTYNNYLINKYDNFIRQSGKSLLFLDKLSRKLKDLTNIYYSQYNYKDFNEILLTQSEKRMIEDLYQDKNFQNIIDDMLLVPELSVYKEYSWIANFYSEKKSDDELVYFVSTLENYLNSLKHYSIKNTVPKSNILINISRLKNYSTKELAESILNNAKYTEYVDYIISKSFNFNSLYKEFILLIEKNYYKNKIYIPNVLYIFYRLTEYQNKEISFNYYLYSFLCIGMTEYLEILKYDYDKTTIINIIENKTKNINLLLKLYNEFEEDKKLYNLINNSSQKELFLDYTNLLSKNYSEELYDYFEKEFYNILNIDKKREIYKKAARYIRGIYQLENGKCLVDNIIIDLKNSNYQKCNALFEEIDLSIKEIDCNL